MRRISFCLSMVFLLLTSHLVRSETVVLGQFPAPSPDGKQLVFTYRGDLWLASIAGGTARRLTVHEANEYHPNWSPDGKAIVFASDRNGNYDLYVISADGNDFAQLTYLSTADICTDWTPDGKEIIFASRRDFSYPATRLASLYKVPRAGGTPVMLNREFGAQGKISPDGRTLIYTDGRLDLYRKHYHGSMNSDIWRLDLKTHQYTQLTNFDGNDFFPLWSKDGQQIYYVSHQDGTANIWQMKADGSQPRQLTFHQDDGVWFANIARQAPVLAYCRGSEIWILNLDTGKSVPIKIEVPDDPKENQIEWKTFTNNATEMALSPDEKYIAAVIHGEIFIVKNKEKGTKTAVRLTNSPFREQHVSWTPNGDSLLFVSDQNGNDDIFLLISADPAEKNLYRALKHRIISLTADTREEIMPKTAPDGKSIAFIRDQDLWIMDRQGKNTRCVLESWNAPQFAWSPDSKWLAYAMEDREFNRDIFIIPAEGGHAVNISQHPDNDQAPVWSADGKKLGFCSRRNNDTFDIWYVFLSKTDDEKTKAEWEEEEEKVEETKNKKDDSKDKSTVKKEAEKIGVKIDFTDIHKRLRRLTTLPGDETQLAISPNGKTFIFNANAKGQNELWSIEWDGSELKQLTESKENPIQINWSKDGKTIFYLKSGGALAAISPDGKTKRGIDFDARMDIDHRQERLQMFHEGWRVLNQNFYDPKFHGVDWAAMRKKYGALIEKIGATDEFYTAIEMLLGELNASHLGISPPNSGDGIQTGMLGLSFDETYSGKGLKIARVMPNGPCDQMNVQVATGEILLAVDGQEILPHTNLYALLNQKVNRRVELRLVNAPGERTLVVKPIDFNALMHLEYERWVQQKRQLVNRLSAGKLAYLHIQGMGWPNLEQFQMELFSEAQAKAGLLIDVRFNGGGWITDYLLTMLQAKPHAQTQPRGGERGYPQDRRPFYAWNKPVAALCNQYSFSNAEIFSHAMKVLKLGKVIGEATPGAVISTGGTQLLDGSSFRIPYRGWFNLETGLNQENHGAIPDVLVKVQKGDEDAGIDRQLEAAVRVLLDVIQAGK